MPALIKTRHVGSVVWLGFVPNRSESLRSVAVERITADFDGIKGEDHSGLTRPSCSRVTQQYPKGTSIRNTRQICLVSQEELDTIARTIGVEVFDPAWVGANIVVSGISDFTHVPPSSRLQFAGKTTLTVDMENRPCVLPAPVIDQDAPGHGRAFKAAATGRRGVTAWVERAGPIRLGDEVHLHIPDQRAWQPEMEVVDA